MAEEDIKVGLLADENKINFTELDLFDRVINLKFTVLDITTGNIENFVLRSDFEFYSPDIMENVVRDSNAVFNSEQKGYIRKCQHKPSIKVQYKRVSLSSAVAVNIFIHNFYMLDRSGKLIINFNRETHRITQIELAMGYFGQFQALYTNKKPETFNDLFTFGFKNAKDDETTAQKFGITSIIINDGIYAQTDKLPPDMILRLHGFVGNFFSPKLDVAPDSFNSDYEKLKSSPTVINIGADNESFLEQIYFTNITKQWLKEALPDDVKLSVKTKTKNGVTYTEGDGLMSTEEAEKYGIRVFLSNKAKEYSKAILDAQSILDSEGNIVYPVVKIDSANTAEEKINAIHNAYALQDLQRTRIDTMGHYLVYHKDELNKLDELLSDTVENFYKRTPLALCWKNQIPAVHNITTDALCTISCPFFCFINPFEKLKFKSRYALGGIVSYYANFNVTENEFFALWQDVSFATVEDINDCTIVCTGQRRR